MNDVGRPAELLFQFGELGVEILVLDPPLLAVLRVEDVLLGVVDDRGLGRLRIGRLVDPE